MRHPLSTFIVIREAVACGHTIPALRQRPTVVHPEATQAILTRTTFITSTLIPATVSLLR
jgi:hypothetical protein